MLLLSIQQSKDSFIHSFTFTNDKQQIFTLKELEQQVFQHFCLKQVSELIN